MIQRGEERPTEFVAVSALPHVILHAGLARSCRIHCRNLWRTTFSLGRRCPPARMRGGGKCSSRALSHHLRPSLLSRNKRVILWRMDSATSPFGSAQNDRGGGIQRRLKVFGLENPTQRKSVAISMDFLMMLYVLVLDCCHVHRFWIDTHCFLIDPFL